jgi:hypothetical protein
VDAIAGFGWRFRRRNGPFGQREGVTAIGKRETTEKSMINFFVGVVVLVMVVPSGCGLLSAQVGWVNPSSMTEVGRGLPQTVQPLEEVLRVLLSDCVASSNATVATVATGVYRPRSGFLTLSALKSRPR